MLRGISIGLLALALVVTTSGLRADDDASAGASISGAVVDQAGKPLHGVMLTAFDADKHMSTSVFSQMDGKFQIRGLDPKEYRLRARLIGLEDASVEKVKASQGSPKGVDAQFKMQPAKDINLQRPGDQLINFLKFPTEEASLNFKMMCTYCHQVGTIGWRTPEEPVDWELMVTRMDGYAGLHEETKKTLVPNILEHFSPEAIAKWPKYVPPPAPEGESLKAVITEWEMGKEDAAMIHDMEIGADGRAYTCDMTNDAMIICDPKTGEREIHCLPGGKEFGTTDPPILGPHSIERAPNGDMWFTLALGGKMAKWDIQKKEFSIYMSAPDNRRGGYPHTLRVGKDSMVWYTDAATNTVLRMDPNGQVKRYTLPRPSDPVTVFQKNPKTGKVEKVEAKATSPDAPRTGVRGEGGAIVPYGIDIAPDGKIWYAKLNGQRLGYIDPTTDKIWECKPPVYGPRRFAVDAQGIVWVPGWASGDLARFDPKTEEWKVYPLPGDSNGLPYALNVHPKTGDVWVCGTGNDTMIKFDPKTEKITVVQLPTRVTYTREVEFDQNGDIWVCNSNYPVRHIENHHGSVIRIAMR